MAGQEGGGSGEWRGRGWRRASAPVEKPWIVRKEPFDTELPPSAYADVAAAQSYSLSAVSIAAWSRSILLCSVTSEPGMYPAIGACAHAAVLASS